MSPSKHDIWKTTWGILTDMLEKYRILQLKQIFTDASYSIEFFNRGLVIYIYKRSKEIGISYVFWDCLFYLTVYI